MQQESHSGAGRKNAKLTFGFSRDFFIAFGVMTFGPSSPPIPSKANGAARPLVQQHEVSEAVPWENNREENSRVGGDGNVRLLGVLRQ